MPLAPRLLALATAVPSYVLGQEEVVERIKRLFGRSAVLDRLLPVFANSGIDRRYSSVPLEWYDEPHGWAERWKALPVRLSTARVGASMNSAASSPYRPPASRLRASTRC
jgi:predicted naringenin-chalcone synthase